MLKRVLQRGFFLGLLALVWASTSRAAWAVDVTPGRDCASASRIDTGVLQRGYLSGPADQAVYRVVLDQRSLMDVTVESGNLELRRVELLDSSCTPLQLRGSGNILFSVPTPLWTLAPGVYFIRFAGVPAPLLGLPFTFQVNLTPHRGHDCVSAESLASGPNEGELVYPEDREVYKIELKYPGQIHAWTTGELQPPNEPYLDLMAPDCSTAIELQTNDDSYGVMTVTLSPGTYYLAVRPEPHTLGKYALYVEFYRDEQIYDPFWYVELN